VAWRQSEQSRDCAATNVKDAANSTDWRTSVAPADLRSVTDGVERRGKLVEKQVRCRWPVAAPPRIDSADLSVSLRRRPNRQGHRRRRSSPRRSDAGRRSPACADCHDAESASCKARRSSSVRSSSSSSATSCTTVPSGSVVGSSRTRPPFSTRARSGRPPPDLCEPPHWLRPNCLRIPEPPARANPPLARWLAGRQRQRRLRRQDTDSIGAGGGNRTHTSRRKRDFESRASASFTTPARRETLL
jgi:hypothetical protein